MRLKLLGLLFQISFLSTPATSKDRITRRTHIDHGVCGPAATRILEIVLEEASRWIRLAIDHTLVIGGTDFDNNLFRAIFSFPPAIYEFEASAKTVVSGYLQHLLVEIDTAGLHLGRGLLRCDSISGCGNNPLNPRRLVVTFPKDAWIYLVRYF